MITERQKQIKNWLSKRKTPVSPFSSLHFLQQPIDPLFHKTMEIASEKIIYEEIVSPPKIRTFQLEDIPSVVRTRSNLPHWKLSGSTYFITICTLNRANKPLNCFFNANIVEEAIYFYHGKQCDIDTYVIMPDHVHIIMTPYQGYQFKTILQNLKRYTAININKQNNDHGRFWQPDTFDHLVRNVGYWVKFFDYIHYNPLKAGIVRHPEDYMWSSLKKWYK